MWSNNFASTLLEMDPRVFITLISVLRPDSDGRQNLRFGLFEWKNLAVSSGSTYLSSIRTLFAGLAVHSSADSEYVCYWLHILLAEGVIVTAEAKLVQSLSQSDSILVQTYTPWRKKMWSNNFASTLLEMDPKVFNTLISVLGTSIKLTMSLLCQALRRWKTDLSKKPWYHSRN